MNANGMTILGIDPGQEQSAYVFLHGGNVIECGIEGNEEIAVRMRERRTWFHSSHLAIEGIACYGMPVGAETFGTCIWIGRFIECYRGPHTLIYRPAVKSHLCKSAKAKDPHVRQALIDRFGPGKQKAIGTKKNKGPLYEVTSHCWAALAVAVTYWDQHITNPPPPGA